MEKTVKKLATILCIFLGSFLFFNFASADYSTEAPATVVSNVLFMGSGYCSTLPTSLCFIQRCNVPAFASKYPTAFTSWPYPTDYSSPSCSETSGGCQNICNSVLDGWDMTTYFSGQTGQAGVFIFNGSAQPVAYIPLYVTNGTAVVSIGNPTPVNGVCGTSNQIEASEMPTTGLCSSGTATTYPFTGLIWQWSCNGSNGGTNDNCFAYATGEQNVTPVCGSNNTQNFSDWSQVDTSPTAYCSVGLQINNSYTSSGQFWSCTTLGTSTSVSCSFTVTASSYPSLPSETDCSSYAVPDKWFCEMNNTLKSFFLPSQSKLDEFNQTMNSLKNKAPFNYLSVAGASINSLSQNINTKSLSITILGNNGVIPLDEISSLTDILKKFSIVLTSIAMFLWARIYITHFFK